MSGRPTAGAWPAGAAVLSLAALLAICALAAPGDHDEGQYIAAAALSTRLLIFRDFLSLQTPLHAWLYAPIAVLAPGHVLLAMRLVTALTATVTVLLVFRAQRRISVGVRAAAFAAAMMATCGAFLFAASVVRNDMLPAMLASLGLWTMLGGDGRLRTGAAGLLFGLAVSSKLSFLPMALAPLLVVGWRPNGVPSRPAIAYGAGLAMGLLPAIAAALPDPHAFFHGTVGFAGSAPFHWYRENGLGGRLGARAKLTDSLSVLAHGPAILALLLMFVRPIGRDRADRILLATAAGGIVGLLVPTPTQIQYALPVLPPLFILLGRRLETLAAVRPRAVPTVVAALIALAAVGSLKTVKAVAAAFREGLPALHITRSGHAIGAILAADGRAGAIATLSPDRVVDSGFPIDPRFATGPFVYRSGALLTAAEARSLHVVTPATLAGALDARPPLAIVTGYEGPQRRFRIDLDAGLARYARDHRYRSFPLPDRRGTVWLRPARGRSRPEASPAPAARGSGSR